ncbi:IS21 family transposase [Brevundimonas nasdae]|uniref:IS21 family transposase n=1 Tax=Brevundimonas nasdae TaxID=172043 RepID=UPI003F6921EB
MIDLVRDLSRLILTTEFGNRQIARILNCAPNTVRRYRLRLKELQLSWAQAQSIKDASLLSLINDGRRNLAKPFVIPDWSAVERELRRPGVTVTLLFQEYCSTLPPEGRVMLSEREFGRRLHDFRKTLSVSMRQVHKAGEKLFVDFSGKRIGYRANDGRTILCEVFVGTLGASGYTYVEAVRSQTLPDWTMAHVRALEFFGGAPKIFVPDCLKSGVTSWKRGEVEINPTYAELAAHYGAVVIPARPRKPKDKAHVERAVSLAQRWILAVLRNRIFHSLDEVNAAIRPLLQAYNDRHFSRQKDQSRRSLFDSVERAELRSLPVNRFEFGAWSSMKTPRDYHVMADGRAYSVPHTLIGKSVRIRLGDRLVRVYHQGQEVAVHPRRIEGYEPTTLAAHRPPNHRAWAERDAGDTLIWASGVGPSVRLMVESYLEENTNALIRQQKLGALRTLAHEHGGERLDKACSRALRIGARAVTSIRSMLKARMEDAPIHEAPSQPSATGPHRNVRGAVYFGGEA